MTFELNDKTRQSLAYLHGGGYFTEDALQKPFFNWLLEQGYIEKFGVDYDQITPIYRLTSKGISEIEIIYPKI